MRQELKMSTKQRDWSGEKLGVVNIIEITNILFFFFKSNHGDLITWLLVEIGSKQLNFCEPEQT